MSKNYFLRVFAAIGILFAASCSQDELMEQQFDDTSVVSFNISTEDAIASRAIGDGTKATTLYYMALHDADPSGTDPNKVQVIFDKEENFDGTLNLTLAKGRTYKLAFWAQATDAPYTVSVEGKHMCVNINYEGANNAENRDAFTAKMEYTVTGNDVQSVTLKRPLAQINVGMTPAQYTASGIEVTGSKVELRGEGAFVTKYDALGGEICEVNSLSDGPITYTMANVPNENFSVSGVAYKYLSTCYVFPAKNQVESTYPVVDAKFTFRTGTGAEIVLENGVNNIPIRSNWRTNIFGDILTSNVDINVAVEPNFDNDEPAVVVWDGETAEEPQLSEDGSTYLVSKPSEWAWLAGVTPTRSSSSGVLTKNVKLMSDIDFGGHAVAIIRVASRDITIDGNGKILSNIKYKFPNNLNYVIGLLTCEIIPEGSTITIKDLTLERVTAVNNFTAYTNDPKGFAAVLIGDVQNNTTVNIENVKVKNSTIKGIQSVGALVGFIPGGSTVNVKGSTVVSGNNLSNHEFVDESGFVCGLVGKVAGTLNIESSVKVSNNIIDAYYASKRGAKSINAIAALRANGTINSRIPDANVVNNTITRKPIGVPAQSVLLNTVEDLTRFAQNYTDYNGKYIVLNNDLDLTGVEWFPIGTSATQFSGTFDGCGNTIRNLSFTETLSQNLGENEAIGFFGWVGADGSKTGTVKNLTLDNANVEGGHNVGVICGYLQLGEVSNCVVSNSNVNARFLSPERDGDKCGGAVGFVGSNSLCTVKDITVKNTSVKARRNVAKVIGGCYSVNTIGTLTAGADVVAEYNGDQFDDGKDAINTLGNLMYHIMN